MLHSTEPAETVLATTGPANLTAPRQADTDAQLIELWLHGRSRHTQAAYRHDAQRLFEATHKPLHQITLGDLQNFATGMDDGSRKPASRHRTLSSVKSLFAFAHRIGYLPFDTARPLRLPGIRNGLSERILDEGEVQRMMALERQPRNHVLLTLIYAAGLRVSEVCSLHWNDLQTRDTGGQVTVFGKGKKTRTILIPASVWAKLMGLRGDKGDAEPVFRSRKKGNLQPTQVWRIVGKAAKRAGIVKAVSTHWFRHAHASHALDRGAPISLVQATLGHASVATTGRYLHARPSDSSANYLSL